MKILSAWDLQHGKKADDDKLRGIVYQPIQMVDSSEKDDDWARANIDWFEELGIKQLGTTYSRVLKNYELANGIIDKEDYIKSGHKGDINDHNNISETYLDFSGEDEIPEAMELKFFPIIPNVINVLTGEFSKRYQQVNISAVDQFSKNEKLDAKFEKIQEFVVAKNKMKLFNNLIESGYQPETKEELAKVQEEINQKVMSLPEVQDVFSKNYRSQVEQWAQHQIKEDDMRFNMYQKENMAFKDYLVSDSQFWHISLEEEDYDIENWSPINTFYHLSPETKYVSEGNYVGRITMMSVPDVIDTYGTKLQKYDITVLEQLRTSGYRSYQDPGVRDEFFYDTSRGYHDQYPNDLNVAKRFNNESMSMSMAGHFNFFPSDYGDQRGFYNYIDGRNYNQTMVRVTEVYWKSQKRMGFLTKIDEEGIPTTAIVTENHTTTIKPLYDTKFYKDKCKKTLIYGEHIDWFWINEVWGGRKLDSSDYMSNSNRFSAKAAGSIYFDMKPLKFQFKGENDLWDARLPVEGITKTDIRLPVGVALVDLMKPYQILHNLANNQICDLMIDERGTVVLLDQGAIPTNSMGEDWGKNNLAKVGYAMDEFGILPVDTSLQNMGDRTAFSHFQTLNLEQSARFVSRMNIAQWAKNEALSTVGISPQRLGEVASRETATGINQAVNNSYSQTEMYFVEHINFLMPRLRNMMINAAQYYNSTKPSLDLQYMTEANETVMFNIDGYELLARDLQVYTNFKPNSKAIMEQMKAMVMQNNTTNADIHDLLKIMTSDTPSELIEAAEKSVEKFNQNQQQQNQHQQDLLNKQLQAQEQEKQGDRQFEATENQKDRETDIAKATISAMGFAQDTDINTNQVPDVLELGKFNQELTKFQKNIEFQEKKLNSENLNKQETNQIKREDIQSKREMKDKDLQIARENQTKSELEAKKKLKIKK